MTTFLKLWYLLLWGGRFLHRMNEFGERFIITRRGISLCVVISMKDFLKLTRFERDESIKNEILRRYGQGPAKDDDD